MNKLKLKTANQESVVYLYIPEGKGEPGEILVNLPTGEATVTSPATEDYSVAGTYYYYGHKAAKAIVRCVVETKNLPLEFTNAWY